MKDYKNPRGLVNSGMLMHTWRDRFEDSGGFEKHIPERGFSMKKTGDKAEVMIYEQIGVSWWDGTGVGAKQFADDLKALGDVKSLDIRINSPGGDVFEADAIYSLLNNHSAKKNVFIDGLAASAASYIAMVGDTISIAEHAKFMIHNAWGLAMGNANELRKLAETLDTIDGSIRTIYAARTGNSDKQLSDWMDAETWFTGQQAIDNKFADVLIPAKSRTEDKSDSFIETMRMRLELARV